MESTPARNWRDTSETQRSGKTCQLKAGQAAHESIALLFEKKVLFNRNLRLILKPITNTVQIVECVLPQLKKSCRVLAYPAALSTSEQFAAKEMMKHLRWFWNEMVAYTRKSFEDAKAKGEIAAWPSFFTLCSVITALRNGDEKRLQYLKLVPVFALRQVARSIVKSYDAYRKGDGKPPRFKGWMFPIGSICFSTTTIEDSHFYFGRFIHGRARIWAEKEPNEKLSFGRLVLLPSGRWEVQLVLNREEPQKTHPAQGKILGVDVCLDGSVVTSDGEKISMPARTLVCLNRLSRRRKFLQRKAARGKRKSGRGRKIKQKIARLFERERGIRTHYNWALAVRLAESAETVTHEGFSPRQLQENKNLSGAIHAVAWGDLWTKIGQACEKRGGTAVEAPQNFASSKLCNVCSFKNTDLKLSDRAWICVKCGSRHHRDLNAALNLQNFGRQQASETVAGNATVKNEQRLGNEAHCSPVAISRQVSDEITKRISTLQGLDVQVIEEPLRSNKTTVRDDGDRNTECYD